MRDVVCVSGFVNVERALNHEADTQPGVMKQHVLLSEFGKS
jgi:hypothetical protein